VGVVCFLISYPDLPVEKGTEITHNPRTEASTNVQQKLNGDDSLHPLSFEHHFCGCVCYNCNCDNSASVPELNCLRLSSGQMSTTPKKNTAAAAAATAVAEIAAAAADTAAKTAAASEEAAAAASASETSFAGVIVASLYIQHLQFVFARLLVQTVCLTVCLPVSLRTKLA
jgi:hypothetical protein